jgi:hypothetical protein
MAHLVRRRLKPPKNTASASAVPPGETQNNILVRFSALDAAVVLTVSVAVWAAVPLRETETGFRLQVGMSLTSVIAVVTLHVRLTAPLNPFVPTTLTVIAVVAPGPVVKPDDGRLIV